MEPIAIVKQHLEHYAAGRWDAYRAALSNDAVYEEISNQSRARGIEAFLTAVQRWKKAFPDLVAHVREAFAVGDRVFAEVEWTGTHRGPLDGPFGAIAPTQKHGSVKAALVYTVAGGKITALRHYFDALTVLMQLGAIPAAVARPAAQPAAPKPSSQR